MAQTPKMRRRPTAPVARQKPLPEQVRQTFQEATTDLMRLAKHAKLRFNQLDTATKRKVIAGLSGVAALLALRARHRRRKRNKDR